MGEYDSLFGKPLRLFFYDIENSPLRVFTYDLRPKYIPPEFIDREQFMYCWSGKFSDEDKIHSYSITPAEAKKGDDARIVDKLRLLMEKADYIVAHNGNRHDEPMTNTRLLMNELAPMSAQTIDTYRLSRSFKLPSYKLDYLAQRLGFEGKKDISIDDHVACFYGDSKALKKMREYNRHDSVILEHVFHAMRPYVKKLPRLIDATEWRQEICPYCGSKDRARMRSDFRTNANSFPNYRCKNPDCQRTYRGYAAIGTRKLGTMGTGR